MILVEETNMWIKENRDWLIMIWIAAVVLLGVFIFTLHYQPIR